MLSSSPGTTRPRQVVNTDLVGPLPRSSSGFTYVLTICDLFAIFVLVFPLRTFKANGIVRVYEEIFLLFGALQGTIMDSGKQFSSRLLLDLLSKYNVYPKYVSNFILKPMPWNELTVLFKIYLSSSYCH